LVQAQEYCRWRNQSTTRVRFSLPTEAQWEKAAAGPEGRKWPWGDVYEASRVALGEARVVDSTPNGESPYGCADMAGNVYEWTITETSEGSMVYALKGGSFFSQSSSDLLCATRKQVNANDRSPDIGFRLVLTFVREDD
jgi:formylglycine-generating enzyme required for sulfatase activity